MVAERPHIMVVLIYRVTKDGINENPADLSQSQPEKP